MSAITSIRLSPERLKRLQKEAKVQNQPLATYLKNLVENWEDICMQYYWSGIKEYKNGEIEEDILRENGIF